MLINFLQKLVNRQIDTLLQHAMQIFQIEPLTFFAERFDNGIGVEKNFIARLELDFLFSKSGIAVGKNTDQRAIGN